MKSSLCAFIAVVSLAGWVPMPAAPQSAPPRVLVMPFAVEAEAPGTDAAISAAWLGEAASTLLADELTARGYRALPREDRVAVFDRLHLPMSPDLTHATMIRVAELIGASEVVFGDVRLGQQLVVRARTIRLDTGQLLPDVTDRGSLTDIFALFGRMADQVGRRSGGPAGTPMGAVAPMPLPALENYIKGLIAVAPASQQRFLESAMSQAPRDGRVLNALWSVYADQGLDDKALSAASAVPSDAPQFRRGRFNVALSLIELKRFDGAIKELSALHTQQRSGAVSNAMGIAELRRGTLPASAEKAAPFFERAANETAGETAFLFNLGYARALAGDSAGALIWLRETVRHDAADGDAHLVMGAVLASAGRTAEAQRELDLARLLGTSLDSVPATVVRVPPALERVPSRLDDQARTASALIAPAQRDQKETAQFHLARGRSLVKEERDREAIAELRRAIYLAPYEDEPHLLLGRLYQKAGRFAEAIDEFKVALWSRETAAARLALGQALVGAGDREAARREFERVLALAPDSTDAADARVWLKKIGG